MTLAKARAAACKNWLAVCEGEDPFPRRPGAVVVRRREPTFKQLAAEVIERKRRSWTDPKHPRDWQHTLERYVYPVFGDMLVSRVEIEHVLAALTPIWDEVPVTARRVRSRIRAVLASAKTLKFRCDNPADDSIYGLLPRERPRGEGKRHHAAVPYKDLGPLVVALRGGSSCAVLTLLTEFIVLTAVRSGEARGARWSEIDLDDALWYIPLERMKMSFPLRVPLAPRPLAILREVREMDLDPASGLVFPGSKPGTEFADSSVLNLLRRHHKTATVHGMRSSFRDWVEETEPGMGEAAERALAHARRNQTLAAYLRTDLFDMRRGLMQRWADYVVGASGVLPRV